MGDETKIVAQDTSKVGDELKGVALENKKATQTQKPVKTYTQQDVDTITANVGRQISAELQTVTTERDTLKGQLDKVNTEITATQTNIEDLNKQIEELSQDDPDKTDLVKLRKEAKLKLASLTARELMLTERETKVQKFERDQLVFDVAENYVTASGEDADADSLRTAAERWKVTDRAGLEALAEEKGWKLKSATTPNEPEPSAPDSGRNSGGGIDLNTRTPKELLNMAYSKKK